MTHEQELIWLAGLLEGEGYFQMRYDPRRTATMQPAIQLVMTDEDVVSHASAIMESPSVRKQVRPNKNQKPTYWTGLTGRRAVDLMRTLLPFMGNRRKAKIESILEAWASRSSYAEAVSRRTFRNNRNGQKNLLVIERAS